VSTQGTESTCFTDSRSTITKSQVAFMMLPNYFAFLTQSASSDFDLSNHKMPFHSN